MSSAVYKSILESYLRPSAPQLKLGNDEIRPCNTTAIPCTAANLQPNGWKEKYQGVSSDLRLLQLDFYCEVESGNEVEM